MHRPTHPDGTPYRIVLLEDDEVAERVATAEADFLERLDVERERAIRQGLHEYARRLNVERDFVSHLKLAS